MIQPTVFSANGLRPVSSEFDRGHDQVKYSILSAMPAASRRSPRSASAAYGLPVRERSADLRGDRACACHQGSYVRSVLNLRDRFDRRLGRPSSVTGAHPLARSAIHHHSDAASQSERDILTLGGKKASSDSGRSQRTPWARSPGEPPAPGPSSGGVRSEWPEAEQGSWRIRPRINELTYVAAEVEFHPADLPEIGKK